MTSYECYAWFRITNYLDQFIEGYEMNHSVNKLFYELKGMDKDLRKTISETVGILFNSSEKDSQLEVILNRLGSETTSREGVFHAIYQTVHIIRLFINDGDLDKAKIFISDVKKQLARRFLMACTEEKINPSSFLAVTKLL